MNNLIRLTLVLSLGGLATLSAQPTPPAGGQHGPHGRGPGRGSPLVRALDTDKDGELSAAEIANAATALRALDTNGDGMISADELRPPRPADAPARPADAPAADRPHPVDPVMLALDANGDGALSAAEIANAPASLRALDANKDGKLTRDELRPLPPTS